MAVTSSVPARWEPDVELGLTWACQSGGDRCASWLRRSIQVTRHRRSTWLVQWPVSLHWLQTDKQTDRQTNRATEKHTTVTWLQAGLSSSESLSCRWWRHPGMMYVAEQNTIAQSQHCQRCHRLQPITSLSISTFYYIVCTMYLDLLNLSLTKFSGCTSLIELCNSFKSRFL